MSTKLRALIVEDSEQDTLLLARELERAGYDLTYKRVETAEDFTDALARESWDIIFADYTMPRFRGTEALNLLNKSAPDIPFIFVSGTIGEATAVEAMYHGARDYIVKGNLQRLAPAVERELREAEVRRERRQAEKENNLLHALLPTAAEAEDFRSALAVTLHKVCEATGWTYGEAWVPRPDGKALDCGQAWCSCAAGVENFKRASEAMTFAPGQGLPGRIWLSKQPEWVPDVTLSQTFRRRDLAREAGLKAAVAVPIVAKDEVVAVMNFFTSELRAEDERTIRFISAVAAQLGTLFRRKRAEEQAQRNLERIQVLREIDQAITSTLDLDAILSLLLEKIDPFLRYPFASTVMLLNRETHQLEPVACRHLDETDWKRHLSDPVHGRGNQWIVLETKAPLKVLNVQTHPQTRHPGFMGRHGLVSFLGVPLTAKGETLGVLSIYAKEEHDFSDEEVGLLTDLANQASLAIHNAQLYEEMSKLAGDLVKSNRVKDEFLSVMSHELRTPLNVVMGYSGMIKDGLLGDVNSQQEEALGKIMSRANDQLAIVNNILHATVLEAEKIKIESHEVSLGDFLNQLRAGYDAPINKELTLNWDYPLDLPVIKMDSGKLKQILQNLINNALKFTSKGSVTISAKIRQQEEDLLAPRSTEAHDRSHASRLTPSYVEFKVADTGAGILQEHLPFIFDKFRQVDSSETRSFGGVGMGLYIVKKFTELLSGTVEVESEPGKGSTFTV